ncbi:MAG: MotA/TolQ/ExbB proton channel family protein [Clostridiales bacterium]|nr:MotA/TolQ/ExbB proton channel family protein [Clostridiales bacterium]
MKKTDVISGVILLSGAALLLALAPDRLSMIMVGFMGALMIFGFFIAVLPSSHFRTGFRHASALIEKKRRVQSQNMWITIARTDALFMNETLDAMFNDYKEKIKRRAQESSRSLYDVSDVINEAALEVKTWQRVTSQIPNMLTALGILGTFIGLIQGISDIRFSSVDVAVVSIQSLLAGISTAFYTSVAGVVLSILYTLVSRTVWNLMLQGMDAFFHDFHMYVSDPADVRDKLVRNANVREILKHLDELVSLRRVEESKDE